MDFTPLRIRLPFGSEDEFIARYGVHVGRDGFFLATRAPKAPGTQLAFDLVLQDGSPVLSGEGVVARVVSGNRTGMVIRFLHLDARGTALVERIVAGRPVARAPTPARTETSEAPTWPGDPVRDVARITAAGGRPRPPGPAAPAPPPEPPSSPTPVDDLAPPPEEAPTWPGDPTRDLARIAAAGAAGAPPVDVVPRPAEPKAPAAPPVETAARVASFPPPPPRAPEPPPRAPRPLGPAAPEPTGRDASPPPPEADVPLHLRPTPAVGVPRAPAPKGEAHVHTAITPVRGVPVLGPEVVALLSGGEPEAEGEQPTGPGARPLPTTDVPGRPPAGELSPSPLEAGPAAPAPVGSPPTVPRDGVPSPGLGSGFRARAPEAIPLPAPSTAQPAKRAPAPPAPPAQGGARPGAEAAALTTPPVRPPASEVPAADLSRAATEPETLLAPAGPSLLTATVEARGVQAPSSGPAAGETPAAARTESPASVVVLGLDIGTTSARVAWARDGRTEVLGADAEGPETVPCRLVRDGHGVLRVQQPGEPDEPLWVGSPVTLLGAHADSPAIRTLLRRWPVAMVADERGEVAFDWAGVTVTPVELVAVLVRSLRTAAERRTGAACTQAVLVVPAAFTLLQRARLREAAERAGLTVLRLLNAPTAAALAYAHDRGMARRRVLVWRMGAATSDAAVVAISGNDLDVVSSGGDGALGGANFDEVLALALDKTARTDPARLRTRVAQAERCRYALTSAERALVPPALEGEPVISVSRGDLEVRTAALVERSVLLAQEVLRAASLSAENIDALVLAGGMARVPHVRRAVEAAFGKPAVDVDPVAAPAVGAALLGAALSAPASGKARPSVVEVLAVPLEAVAPEFGHQRALDRNTRLPAEKTLALTLPPGQPLEVQLFQGMARAPDPRSFLGLLHAAGVERSGEWALHLSLGADGLFQGAVTPPGGKRRPLVLQAAPPPEDAEASEETGTEEPDPGARLIGGLKRLFGRR